jgi:L-galactose dehydrogenase
VALGIDLGINFFDVSPYYGLTLAEKRLGRALHGRRKEVLLSTKCGRYGVDDFDFSAARVRTSLEESLTRLQTDYVDILLAHDIEFGDLDEIVEETLPAMRTMQREGKARFIGICGYPLPVLRQTAERAKLDIILSYCHYNPLNTDLELEVMGFALERGIGLINASPMHMGLLNGRAAPAWHPAPQPVREAAKQFVRACAASGRNPATTALRFCLENPGISTTLTGMSTAAEVRDNLAALDEKIDPRLREEIAAIAFPVAGMEWPSGRQSAGVSA